MSVPIVFFGKGFVNAVVEVFVVRENNMAANIIQLSPPVSQMACQDKIGGKAHEALFGYVGRGKTARRFVRVDDHP